MPLSLTILVREKDYDSTEKEEAVVEGKREAPYGSWVSPISADLIVSGTTTLREISLVGQDAYWLEGRPWESGRNVLVRHAPDGQTTDVTPAPFNVRTRVHEYGGGAYCIHQGRVLFSNFADNRLYEQDLSGGEPHAITPEAPYRYADMIVDEVHNRIIAVREDHSHQGQEAENTLVAIDLSDPARQTVLASGNDFYSNPRISPDGRHLAYLTWCHPNMPWDGTELWLATLTRDGLTGAGQVAGSPTESIFQPEWSPSGDLFFMSDRTGWWNPYRLHGGSVEPVLDRQAEFGQPQWSFGMSTYGFLTPDTLVCKYTTAQGDTLARVDVAGGTVTDLQVPYTSISDVRVQPERVVFLGASATTPTAVVQYALPSGETQVLGVSTTISIDPGYLSRPEAIEFPTERGLSAHAYFYPPTNKDFAGLPGETPPLIVRSHGGPTGHTSPSFNLSNQFWTSRGFALVDVNYGGSSGYGRPYRERLNGHWGIVDVEDCVNAAMYLAGQGLVDPDRLIIVGGSAGGYTTLAALTFRDEFKAGASYFGLADLVPFVADTHKFESRYLERLIGPFPQREDLYRRRSPVNFTHQLSCPVILFQGLDDKIVPPNQAELMVQGLEAKGLPYAYVAYEREGHGFRKAENIKRTLEAELYFYSRIFGFPLSDQVEPVLIHNLP